MKLEELRIYQQSMILAENIWQLVVKWDYFAKDTIGKQLIRSIDSVAANISEGFGRYFYKEERQFCYYSRGSLSETKTWLTKAFSRELISENEFKLFENEIEDLGIKLNNYINSIGKSNKAKQRMTNDNE